MRNHPDGKLNPEQLDDKYNEDGDGEHPEWTRADWRAAVDEETTLAGYWQWVVWAIEQWEHNDD